MVSLINFKIVDDDLRATGESERAVAASASCQRPGNEAAHQRERVTGDNASELRAENHNDAALDRTPTPTTRTTITTITTMQDEARRPRACKTQAGGEQEQDESAKCCIQISKHKRSSASMNVAPSRQQVHAADSTYGLACCPQDGYCSRSLSSSDVISTTTPPPQQAPPPPPPMTTTTINQNHDEPEQRLSSERHTGGGGGGGGSGNIEEDQDEKDSSFTVTWRNLKFCIEPKWHEKLARSSSRSLAALTNRLTSSSPTSTKTLSTTSDPNELQQTQSSTTHTNTATPRIVLDQLDGSFRSGELTAILGPSGAGKTTLLDCLTGHRKSGLSGSIRISSSPSPAFYCSSSPSVVYRESSAGNNGDPIGCFHCPGRASSGAAPNKQKNLILAQHNPRHFNGPHPNYSATHAGRKSPANSSTGGRLINGENLKVSIIPQNDHLIGHLTVYETLTYASKMKNCFETRNFDHKLNVRRVAQQLGLMSCLGTRINKLSGGQYKRVSIAQELLSSPDILILDEPTSGLDAMTCFQTVQVLKELTKEHHRDRDQKSIAVILTIHQPNSDVFQQFNHVYVVAQGGKCIYEGPPASIESVINRVGLCLPNSYYNPATMIVEVAAGKFGQEAICQLNEIQKKQYGGGQRQPNQRPAADEQNSTGDSAVDCPSSSSSSSSNFDDDLDQHDIHDNDDDENNNNSNGGGGGAQHKAQCYCACCSGDALSESCDKAAPRSGWRAQEKHRSGLVNEGFIMETSERVAFDPSDYAQGNRCTALVLASKDAAAHMNKTTNFSERAGEPAAQDRRKRRRRARKRAEISTPTSKQNSTSSAVQILMSGNCGGGGGGGGGGGHDNDDPNDGGSEGGNGPSGRPEKRLKLNSLKADQKFPFWRHTYLHFHRSWLSIVRDPMLCGMQLALHIIVPVMVSLVYGTYVGKPNACPRAGPIDIMAYALEPTDKALQLQEDLRTTLENIGYIFFKLYGIIFAAMTVTVLTFPLDMHVLVKEFRNGWYGLSSYFLGRTLADIPFQLTLPLLAMALSYYSTGQPYSYMQWRFFSITAILILSSLIAQSQGLLFGAILMDRMKAAVFVAPAATTPIILFAGFLVRTQSIPAYLRPLSNLSYLRYAIEACLISRYGFNQCECDPAIFNQTVPELPPIARSMLDYWLSSFKPPGGTAGEDTPLTTGVELTTLSMPSSTDETSGKPDLFNKLIDSLARANSFGRNITSCEQVVPYPMIDYDLKDSQLFSCFAILLTMLVFTRLLTFFIVCFKVKRKV